MCVYKRIMDVIRSVSSNFRGMFCHSLFQDARNLAGHFRLFFARCLAVHTKQKLKLYFDFNDDIFHPALAGRTRTKDKYRVVYSDHQRLELEKEFHYSRYITIRRKAELANSVGLSERQVKKQK